MSRPVVLDCFGVLDPAQAKQVCADHGLELVGLTAYQIGSSISMCQYGASGSPVISPGRHLWLESMTQHGLGVLSNFELNASDPEGGATRGHQQGALSVACQEAAGAPRGAGVYVSNDAIISNWTAVLDYFRAFEEELHTIGAQADLYGQASLFVDLRSEGYSHLWKAPDGTSDMPGGTVLVQSGTLSVGGTTCDIDHVVLESNGALPDMGMWNLDGLLYHHQGGTDVNVPTLTLNETSKVVAWVQDGLKRLGFYPSSGAENGHYGSVTDKAVRAFQKAHNCEPPNNESHFGPASWQALTDALAR